MAVPFAASAIIERHFTWSKRYFGLESTRSAGLVVAYQTAPLASSAMLIVALIALIAINAQTWLVLELKS